MDAVLDRNRVPCRVLPVLLRVNAICWRVATALNSCRSILEKHLKNKQLVGQCRIEENTLSPTHYSADKNIQIARRRVTEQPALIIMGTEPTSAHIKTPFSHSRVHRHDSLGKRVQCGAGGDGWRPRGWAPPNHNSRSHWITRTAV